MGQTPNGLPSPVGAVNHPYNSSKQWGYAISVATVVVFTDGMYFVCFLIIVTGGRKRQKRNSVDFSLLYPKTQSDFIFNLRPQVRAGN